MDPSGTRNLTRRAALEVLGAIGAVLTVECGGSENSGAGSSGSGAASWATGDGKFLEGKDYGNPFAAGVGTACALWKASTQGPCLSNTYHRKDVTEGVVGLPTRLELLVVDTACNPVPDAIVEIWHCSPRGMYSEAAAAEPSDIGYDADHHADLNGGMCTRNDAAAKAAGWFRGYQKAGADGRVTFDTVFPGWYRGRTVHVHFRVTVGTTEYITSQFFFDDALNDEIIADHTKYAARGPKDTTNAADMVISQARLSLRSVVMSHAKQSDGALLAWKAISISA